MKALLLSILLASTAAWAQQGIKKININKEDQKLLKNSELIQIANNALQHLEAEYVYYGLDTDIDEFKIVTVYKSEKNELVQIDLEGLGIISGVDQEFGDPVFENEETTCYVSIRFDGDNKDVTEVGCDVGLWSEQY